MSSSNIVDEILQTEEKFVHFLNVIVDLFETPLRSNGRIMDIRAAKDIFVNVSQIKDFNQQFLDELRTAAERDKKESTVKNLADAFVKNAPFMKLYVQFVNGFEKSAKTFSEMKAKNPAFAKLIKAQRADPRCSNLDLSDMLIMIVQRCPRYELLLRDLLKHTLASDPGYSRLQEALAAITDINQSINEKKRLAERLNRVLQIQKLFPAMKENLVEPHRVYLAEDSFERILKNNTKRTTQLFLFNDLIVIGTTTLDVSLSSSKEQDALFFGYKIIPLPGASVGLNHGKDGQFVVEARSKNTTKSYAFQVRSGIKGSTKAKADEWVKKIQGAIDQANANPNPSPLVAAGVKSTSYLNGRGILLVFAFTAILISMIISAALPTLLASFIAYEAHQHLHKYLHFKGENYVLFIGAMSLVIFGVLYNFAQLKRNRRHAKLE
eukprot:TRINITY_DN1058_c0_g1_i2.p1 TRINITY_DN1058_c0_g1~~TRINITY_DN1058_c0_g1_i2.p1  ORF type:complete len:437 (+),score=101.03 TRINITY_DN1058_c0_g1_i2:50-1360(+)